jgi:dolichol-phosphate mannosyltransferase
VYKDHWIVAIIPAHNEEAKIGRVVDRAISSVVDAVFVVDDCSTDATATVARSRGATVLTHARRRGVGAALRTGIEHARRAGYDVAVILAGNNKDDPAEIPRLLDPIADDRCDLVMGSRYLPGGGCGGDMPLYRRLATRMHPWFMSRFSGKRVTESTNGFRAFRLSLLDDVRINLRQRWLDTYGLEVYLLWKTIKLGYRHAEVPCTKNYPRRNEGYTKMRPVTDWWSILRPVFLLGLGFRE